MFNFIVNLLQSVFSIIFKNCKDIIFTLLVTYFYYAVTLIMINDKPD